MSARYSTRDEAVERGIVMPLEASGVVKDAWVEYDVYAIFEECFGYDEASGHIQAAGFRWLVDEAGFWDSVQRHEFAEARGPL